MIYAIHFIDNGSGSDPGWIQLIDFSKVISPEGLANFKPELLDNKLIMRQDVEQLQQGAVDLFPSKIDGMLTLFFGD